jgi:hypothetical protein
MRKSPSILTRLAAGLACGVAFTTVPALVPAMGTAALAQAQGAQQIEQFKQVLGRYGTFQAHARYGEVWIPAEQVAPRGWHPYPPCNWVHHKELGWYYDDRSEWGAIVHHYGRWAHDAALGWIWVAGAEFSPGWVVWRTSDSWVGWAPMPPDQDVKEISADAFNSDKHWIFMDAKKFGTKCQDGSGLARPASYPTLFQSTKLITEVRFVGGIAIFVLPAPLVINIVDINVGIVPPWSPCFFGAWFWNWNWLMNNIVIKINLPAPQCIQPVPLMNKMQPIKSDPPPAPPGSKQPQTPPSTKQPDRQTELPPDRRPPNYQPPSYVPPLIPLPLPLPPSGHKPRDPAPPKVTEPPRHTDPVPPRVTEPRPPKYPETNIPPVNRIPPGKIADPVPPRDGGKGSSQLTPKRPYVRTADLNGRSNAQVRTLQTKPASTEPARQLTMPIRVVR